MSDKIKEDLGKEESEVSSQNEETLNSDATAQDGQAPQELTAEEKLAEAQAAIEVLQDKYLRQVAEFDNYRKRTIKEKAELIKNASATVLTEILPVIDNLERAMANSGKSEDLEALKEGIELIYNDFMHKLQQQGLKKIDPKGQEFNTDYHEAIAMIPAPTEDLKGKVLDCTRYGYQLNDKVLRHAQVAVGE